MSFGVGWLGRRELTDSQPEPCQWLCFFSKIQKKQRPKTLRPLRPYPFPNWTGPKVLSEGCAAEPALRSNSGQGLWYYTWFITLMNLQCWFLSSIFNLSIQTPYLVVSTKEVPLFSKYWLNTTEGSCVYLQSLKLWCGHTGGGPCQDCPGVLRAWLGDCSYGQTNGH